MRSARRVISARPTAFVLIVLLLAMVCGPTLSVADNVASEEATATPSAAGLEAPAPDLAEAPAVVSSETVPAPSIEATAAGERPPAGVSAVAPAANVFGDAYEPDDTFAAARAIAVNGTPQSRTYHVMADDDWVKFTAVSGETYRIGTAPADAAALTDTFLELYAADGVTMLDSDDDSGVLGEVYSLIEYTATTSGTFYVRSYGCGHEEVGPYLLYVDGASPVADAYEPDDTDAAASPIATDGTPQAHTFHISDDDDWVTFEAIADVTYYIETREGDEGIDTEMYLFDADLNELDYDDDGHWEFDWCSYIEYTPTVDETLYVLVHPYDHDGTGRYLLAVNSDGGDAYEPDNDETVASPIATDGTPQSHTFHEITDDDWVTFEAVAGVTYAIETREGDIDVDTEMYLFDADLNELDYSDDGHPAYDYCSYIEYTPTVNETLYVLVHPYDHDETGRYLLAVTKGVSLLGGDAYEPDDTAPEANPINVYGQPQSHTFHVVEDDDWVTFDVVAGLTYVIDTLPGLSGLDTYLYLYDAELNEIDYDDDDGPGYYSHIEFEPTESGTVYVRAHSYGHSYTGAYLLSVQCSDVTPPVTTSNAVASYTNGASIVLTATDPAPGVGVAATYYILDGGAKQTYTGTIGVTTAGTHTLKFWSVDKVTNDEAPKTVTFTVVVPRPASSGGSTSGTTAASEEPTESVEPTASVEPTTPVTPADDEPEAEDEDEDGRGVTGADDDGDDSESDDDGSALWWVVGGVGVLVLLGLLAALLKRRKK
jgi:hypothetical protein